MSALATSRSWEIAHYDAPVAEQIRRQAHVTPLVARIMAGRGISGEEDVRRFLHLLQSRKDD